jgi:glycosyltransferase involved in cell wall biosynthesis
MTVLFFGTYDRRRHPRVRVLIEGCRGLGVEVAECNRPLADSTRQRVAILRKPWLAVVLAVRVAAAWRRLIRIARNTPTPDLIIVGYLGHFDVHLARWLWPDAPVILDYLISLADTAIDRHAHSRLLHWILRKADRAALSAADGVIVDTEEHRELTAADTRSPIAVVEVGAPRHWFMEPRILSPARLRVVFFGLFTPLQGTDTIARAIGILADAPIDFLMIGTGQDYKEARRHAAINRNVTWLDWIEAEELPAVVAAHDVCLGIFGTGPKARRVVPNKVFQAAAAGCAVITADTPPQRRALGDAGIFVAPGSPEQLAATLRRLQDSPEEVWRARSACFGRARTRFTGEVVIAPLVVTDFVARLRQ